MYRDTLNYTDQETLAWLTKDAVNYFDIDWLWNYYVLERVKNKIWQRTIVKKQKYMEDLMHIYKKLEKENKKVKFITLEKRSDLELFQNNIEDIISDYDYVFIDEFQYAEEGGQKLKYLYDTSDTKFIISGSSSLEIKFQTAKYMVGRMIDFQLSPFSFKEYLSYSNNELFALLQTRFKNINIFEFDISKGFGSEINKRLAAAYEKYSIYGGYPAVVISATREEKEKVIENISNKYLLKDIKTLLELTSDDKLFNLGKHLAAQIGNLINYNELSVATGFNYNNLIKHLNILENTYIIKLLKPYYTNKRLELSKNPKVFFIDMGLRNYLLNDFRDSAVRNDWGNIMENNAMNMLKKFEYNLKFWRTKSKAEIDFVIEKDNSVIPIEIKYVSKRIVGKSFYSFIEKFNPKTGIVITKDYLAEEKIKNTIIKFIPLSYF